MENIDWNSLRPLDGSQPEAFEELCCQLAAREDSLVDSTFVRVGAPDAGVECYWRLQGGDEWGWQAKFFLSPPGSSQWQQIDKSVKRALEKHPRLTRYIVCLPIDRQDPRIEKQKWFKDKWDERVEKWKGWVEEEGMSVAFEYWGRSEILERLSREEHRGRYYFWFNSERFSQTWFSDRFEEARDNVGARYMPEINVELPVAELFDGLGRTPALFERIRDQIDEARGTYGRINPSSTPDEVKESIFEVEELLGYSSDFVEESEEAAGHISWGSLCKAVDETFELTQICIELLEEAAQKKKAQRSDGTEESGSTSGSRQAEPYSYERSILRQLSRDLRELERMLSSEEVALSNTGALLLTGEAGHGKTHLFCDVAKRRVEAGRPTVLLLGEQFRKDEPWGQITNLLGLSCTRKEFLGALDAAAEAYDSKALILIDALNEGEGKYMWSSHLGGMLTAISRYEQVGIALSVRSTYLNQVVPDHLISDRLIKVEHTGFADHELQASKVFFDHYGIERPSIPLLTPEFQNPLFLKLFCEGLEASGLTRIPEGLQGISQIFSFFIDQVNEKLAHPERVSYHPSINNVREAIERLAEEVAQRDRDWIPIAEAQGLINDIEEGQDWEHSLYRQMVSEGVFAEDRFPVGFDDTGDFVYQEGTRFTYERFQDHVIAEYLLNEHLQPKDVSGSFEPGTPLGDLLHDPNYGDAGLIDALAIQIPERTGKELGELIPEEADSELFRNALVESVLWRRRDSFSNGTKDQINEHVLRYKGTYDRFHNILLMVAADPQHPYNADFLHRNLMRRSIAERDRLWSIFLFDEYDYYPESSAVGRVVDWAWSIEDTTHLERESIRLAATALIWFLTTSHRPLRDCSTKALVNLLDDVPDVVVDLLETFEEVNDPYVTERLYAVAYGCAMRTRNSAAGKTLADKTYELIFADENPPVNILTRDYAREIIERPVTLDSSASYDMEKVRPPYGSEWPDDISSLETLEEEYETGETKYGGGLGRILGSVTVDDFSRYVIGTGSFEWSSERLGESESPSYEERFEEFKQELDEEQAQRLEEIQEIRRRPTSQLIRWVNEELDDESYAKDDLEEEIDDLKTELRNSLNEAQRETFDEVVWPYIENPRIDDERTRFELSLIRRFILERILDLRYTDDLFEEFDSRATNHQRYARSGEKPERIGKKYQWIAYYEALARVSDNFKFSGRWSEDDKIYRGPWQVSKVRNIDPSVVQEDAHTSWWMDPDGSWWFDSTHDWSLDNGLKDWLYAETNVPDAGPRLEVTRVTDESEWLVLHGHFGWYEPKASEDQSGSSGGRRQVWYFANSYLLPKSDAEESFDWAKSYDFSRHDWVGEGPRRPKEVHVGYCYLGELYWSPCYRSQFLFEDESRDCEAVQEAWTQTTENFLWERIYDCSGEESVNLYVPSVELIEEMELTWATKARFVNPSGDLVAWDPSFEVPGPSRLLVRKSEFLSYLAENELAIIWTINGEKLISEGGNLRFNERMEITGAYALDEDRTVVGDMSFAVR